MEAGLIDRDRARVISNATLHLPDEKAAVADQVLAAAAAELRLADRQQKAARLQARLDPEGVKARKDERKRDRRVELRREDSGAASLAGRPAGPPPDDPSRDPYRDGQLPDDEDDEGEDVNDNDADVIDHDEDEGRPGGRPSAGPPSGRAGGKTPMPALINVTVVVGALPGLKSGRRLGGLRTCWRCG